MKQWIKRGISGVLFLAGLAGLLTMASAVVVPKDNVSSAGLPSEEVAANGIFGEPDNTIDIVAVGDSEAYSAITPMQIWGDTGYTSYVCGTSAQQLSYATQLLHQVFQSQRPKLVILETDEIYRKITDKEAVLAKLGSYFPVFRFHDRWKTLQTNDFLGNEKYTGTDDFKGYYYRTEVAGAASDGDHMRQTNTTADIPAVNLGYLKEIRALCRANGAELLLLSTPSTVNWNDSLHNGIARVAQQLGCRYLDLNLLNDQVGIDWSLDTRDKGDHLNHSGAVKVTEYLTRYLKSRGQFADHRGDDLYAGWNQALERYKAAVGAA